MGESPTVRRSGPGRTLYFSESELNRAKARLIAQGTQFGAWADDHGYDRRLVYEVLGGRKPCRSGTTHKIAVALGLKAPPPAAQSVDRLEGVRQ